MEDMSQYLWIIFAIYTARGLLVIVNYWIIFEKFFIFPSEKKNKKIWIVFYFVVNYLYRPIINYGPGCLCLIMLVMYLIRVVPFLWTKYGRKPIFLVIALFYGNIIDCIANNIKYIFGGGISNEIYNNFKADFFTLITELLVFCFLIILVLLKRATYIKVYFTKLTAMEYIILFCVDISYGLLEAAIYKSDTANVTMKNLSIITFILLMLLIVHVFMVRDQNTSMNNMIGNLKEPMKQITASYIEMNEKNVELRRFRHDIKNLLLVLKSLITDDKMDQAVRYIDKMYNAIEINRTKMFDTGNYIADALLESKAKIAIQNDIIMTVDGNIPSNRVEDVNMVILISNLLDNAIEAAKQVTGERKIEVQSILKKNLWILSVKNSCVKDIVIRENRIETTKEEKEAHGFGISNIERVAKKYDGNLKLSCENNIFTARTTIMLTA